MRLATSIFFLCAFVAGCSTYSGTPTSTWSAYSKATGKTLGTRRP